ncbi:MAG: MCE family protein [Deltaproteobacteria bacterium]|nr:MCE family protein [Deltaproteobacteria bacterium]
MKSMSTEMKVGIFVILGILALTFFTVRVGRIAIREKGYQVVAFLESAAGLDKNSPVRIAGVEVGKVDNIALEGNRARVTIHLPSHIQLPLDSKVYVKSAGLLGEKYLEIVPGASAQAVPAQGKLAEGGPSVDVDRVLSQLSAVGEDIKSVTESLNHVLGGKEGEENLRGLVIGAKDTAANLQVITKSLERGEGTMGKLLKDDRLYVEARDAVSSLNQVARSLEKGEGTMGKLLKDDRLYVEARDAVSSLNQVARSIEKGEGTLGRLAKDEALYIETREMMKEAKAAFATLNETAQKIEGGEGTLGKLVKDDTLYVKARETMEEARETMVNLKKVSAQLESGQGTLGKLAKDDTLYEETKRAVRSVNKAAEGIQEVTPVTVLGTILGTVLR